MKKILYFIVAISLYFGLCEIKETQAQVEQPVKWKYTVTKVSDTEVSLNAIASIDDKWHLYGQFFDEGGPVRMQFTFKDSPNYEKIGKVSEWPKPHIEHDDIFDIDIQFFEKKVTFSQKIKILSEKDFTVEGELFGQACIEMCVLVSDEFEFKVKGVPGAGTPKTQEVPETSENTVKDTVAITDTVAKSDIITEKDSLITPKKEGEYILSERPKTTPHIIKENAGSSEKDNTSLFWFFIIAFGFGLTALITPCVFPMIPMTVSFFMHGNKDKTKGKMQAIIYGISIIVIYTLPIALVIGISTALGGDSISGDFANWLSTHWIPNIFFFLIFVIFAASFFGMFEIQLPNRLISKSDEKADKGGLLGVFFMAFTLVLVSFSCTGPIVGGILIESTQGGTFIKPIIGMLGFSAGVALPFTMFAIFPNMLQKLPKSGGWLNSVKVVLGFIELALGLKFLSIADQTYHWGILDREIYLALWIVIFSLLGVYLLGKLTFSHDSKVPFLKVPRLIFAIITFSFVIYLIPGMIGAPLKALSGYLPPKATMDFDLEKAISGEAKGNICKKPTYDDKLHLPNGFMGYFDYYEAYQCSKELNKPIFIDFTGHGCVNCREMEANVWSDPRVKEILQEEYIILAMYVDDKDITVNEKYWFTSEYDKKVKKTLGKQNADIQIVNFNKNSQPYYVLTNCKGDVLAEPRAYNLDINEFVKFLKKGVKEFKKLNKK